MVWEIANLECGYTCHAKCQMKAPQDCTGVNLKVETKKSKKKKNKDGEEEDGDSVTGNGIIRRNSSGSSKTPSINTMSSVSVISPISPQVTSPASSAPRPNPVRHIAAAPPPSKYISSPITLPSGTGGSQKVKVLFKYDATSAEELSIKPSDVLTIIEPDDGSGWILAKVGRNEGLVPASYVEIQTAEAPKKGPPVAPRRGAKKTEEPKKKYFKAIYDYDASTELELSIREGDRVAIVAEDKGDGWTEVEMKGKVGSVPSNYIEAVN